ncbi:MAG: AAA family ATPase [Flavobacteriaceae bacterium]|nr:AAA family ATPase [Flavobacteriaceae bacterium]
MKRHIHDYQMQKKIVITGGPGSGKSVVINELKQREFICMPEISREVTLSARKNGIEQLFINNPLFLANVAGRAEVAISGKRSKPGQKLFFLIVDCLM